MIRSLSTLLRLASILAFALPGLPGRAAEPAGMFPKPDRPVAEIVAPQWIDDRARDRTDEVGQVVRLIEIGPGMTIADVGAGNGYYTLRLSPVVGPTGRILAEDLMPDYLAELRRRVSAVGLANVEPVLGQSHDPKLPARAVDVALLVHMYHEIDQPFGLLFNLAGAMKPGGRIGIVDADDVPSRHGTPPALLRCELAAVGYREIGFHRLAKGAAGYLAVFAAPAPENLPAPAAIRPCADERTRRGAR